MKTITLFRPTGPQELALIRDAGWRAFPPRLPDQPIFYPVLNEAYATQIARDWNTKDGGTGYVLRFQVEAEFLSRYATQTVGSSIHQEYWIPAEDLEAFNQHLVVSIELIATYSADR
ncbi:MAG TPA: hypothetical protein VGN17_00685 [Bryobacteraceae bacterium]